MCNICCITIVIIRTFCRFVNLFFNYFSKISGVRFAAIKKWKNEKSGISRREYLEREKRLWYIKLHIFYIWELRLLLYIPVKIYGAIPFFNVIQNKKVPAARISHAAGPFYIFIA